MDPIDTQREAFGRYRVVRPLGEGAAGSVYLAHDDLLGRDVAVKTLRGVFRGSFSGELLGARFNNEARAIAALTHPNVVHIFDMGVEDGVPYLVMEVVTGPSLKERLAGGRLPAPTVRTLGIQIAQALGEAHAHGIVHRDVKPANILEAKPDHFKLADFGVAHVPDSSLTLTGQFLGTPAYAAPETVSRGEFGPASDVYGLCATMYEALAGEPPYDTDPARRLAAMASGEAPRPLPELAPDAPVDLAAAIGRGLEADAASRPDAGALAEILAAAAVETGSEVAAQAGAAAASELSAEPSATAAEAAALAATAALTAPPAASPGPRADRSASAENSAPGLPARPAPGEARDAAPAVDAAVAGGEPGRVPRRSRVASMAIGLAAFAAIGGGVYLVSRIGSGGGTAAATPAAGAAKPGRAPGRPAAARGQRPRAGAAPGADAAPVRARAPADARRPDKVAQTAAAVADAGFPVPDRVPGVAHAEQLIRAHRRQAALRALQALRKRYPKNAYVPFLIGNLYFDRLWWKQGFDAYDAAVALDPGYGRHPTVIHNAIRSLMSDHAAWRGTRFLERQVGRAGVPALRDAAAHSRSLHIRRRAARILRHLGR